MGSEDNKAIQLNHFPPDYVERREVHELADKIMASRVVGTHALVCCGHVPLVLMSCSSVESHTNVACPYGGTTPSVMCYAAAGSHTYKAVGASQKCGRDAASQVLVTGFAGVGKATLAAAAARQLLAQHKIKDVFAVDMGKDIKELPSL